MKTIILNTFFSLIFLFNTSVIENQNQFKNNNIQDVIIVYGSDTCHYCLDTKTFLNKNNIKYTYYDIDKNEKALNEMLNKLRAKKISVSDLKIPVIDKNGNIFTNNIKFEDFLNKIKE